MSDADLSYEMRNERRAADAQLYTLWKNRDARHEEESKQLAAAKCLLKRWAIKCRSRKQDSMDAEREKKLLDISNPMAVMRRKLKH
ncbi:MAG: hypothetical protein KBS42_01210 [Bacteroidales bacterium]|nr:hypothetical protein [Candidatus Colicola coprequi]